MSRPKRDRPVVLAATMCGVPVAPAVRRRVRAESRVAIPLRQTSASSMVRRDQTKAPPIVVMMASTRVPSGFCRHWETEARSCALPRIILRLGVVLGGRVEVSLEGVRQRAMQLWPAARVCLRAERPMPVLAPRKATVLAIGWGTRWCFGD